MLAPPGTVTETDSLQAAPLYRREPFRIFFPLGIAIALAGVGHWFLHSIGALTDFRPVFHAIAQIQGFMTAFAVGFLFTMIPRRTGSGPPTPVETVVPLIALPAVALAAWFQRWVVAEIAWLAVAAAIVAFVVRRFAGATSRRSPPDSFIWIPVSFALGTAGALLMIAYATIDTPPAWMHSIGRGMILEGLFTGLVLGVGGLALPLMTRGAPPADSAATAASRMARAGHAAGAVLLAVSFWVEHAVSFQMGYALRASVVVFVMLLGPQIWRLPVGEGWNRRLIWLAAWMLPAGYMFAAISPRLHIAGLHVVFIGGFALLAFAVSTQVVLGHGGYRELLFGRPWQVVAIGSSAVLAIAARTMMEIDRIRYFGWMSVAAGAFVAAALVWCAFVGSKTLRT